MKVIVIGANGQVGKHIVRLLEADSNYSVTAMIRKEEQKKAYEENGVKAVLGNLEDGVDELTKVIEGHDAVIFTAGSGSKTGPDKTLLVDLDGAVKSMEAAEKAGANRFIMVSAIQAHNRESWKNSPIRPYFTAKHYADRELMRSNLNYTIVRPGGLTNDPGTGMVEAKENLERSTIPREDVARTVVAALKEENTYRRSFDLVSGNTPVEAALKNL